MKSLLSTFLLLYTLHFIGCAGHTKNKEQDEQANSRRLPPEECSFFYIARFKPDGFVLYTPIESGKRYVEDRATNLRELLSSGIAKERSVVVTAVPWQDTRFERLSHEDYDELRRIFAGDSNVRVVQAE